MEGHEGNINDVGFSPEASYAITGGEDNTVRVWGLLSAGQGGVKGRVNCLKVIQSGAGGTVGRLGWMGNDKLWTSESGGSKVCVWDNPCGADSNVSKPRQVVEIEGGGEEPWYEIVTDDEGELMAFGDAGREWMGVAHFDKDKGLFNWMREFKVLDPIVSWTGMNVCLIANPDNHDVGTVGEEKGYEWYIYTVQRKAIQLMKVRPGQCWMDRWGGEEETVAAPTSPSVDLPNDKPVEVKAPAMIDVAGLGAEPSGNSDGAALADPFSNWLGAIVNTPAPPPAALPTSTTGPSMEPESAPPPPPPEEPVEDEGSNNSGNLLSPAALLAKIGAPRPTFESETNPVATQSVPVVASTVGGGKGKLQTTTTAPEDITTTTGGPPGFTGSVGIVQNSNPPQQQQQQQKRQQGNNGKKNGEETGSSKAEGTRGAVIGGDDVKDIVDLMTKAFRESLKGEMQKVGKAVTRSVKEDGEKTRDRTVRELKEPVKESVVEVMEKLVVPSIEAGMKEMFGQINRTMSQGLERMKIDGDKVQKQLDEVIREQGRVVKEVRKENEGLKKTVGTLTNSIMKLTGVIEEMRMGQEGEGGGAGDAKGGGGGEDLKLKKKKMEEAAELEKLKATVKGSMDGGKYESAFMAALQASNVALSLYCCSIADIATIFHGDDGTCKVSQTVLLCLLQQVGSALVIPGKEEFGLEISWLNECSLTIDAEDESIKGHLGAVKAQLLRHVKAAMAEVQKKNKVVEKRKLQGLIGIVTAIGM